MPPNVADPGDRDPLFSRRYDRPSGGYDETTVNASDPRQTDWAAFYLANRRMLAVYARSLAGNDADAQDLIQDVLIRLVRRPRPIANPRAYVMRCLRNQALDRRRGGVKRDDVDVARLELSFLDDRDIDRDETQRRLRAALLSLPSDRREIIVLRIYAELTFAEIADIVERPLSTVSSLYARGIDDLRRRLARESCRASP